MFVSQVLAVTMLWLTANADLDVGLANNETHAKIVGGHPISVLSAPYIVSVRIRVVHEKSYGQGHICGGTIISRRVVCSAAHCFAIHGTDPLQYNDSKYFVVVAGITRASEHVRDAQIFLVEDIFGHRDYTQTTLENDIALLFLNSVIPEGWASIQVLPLAEQPYPTGTLCLINGWGSSNSLLSQGVVPIVNPRICNAIYSYLPASQMCAGWLQGGIDACRGDSGGPLVCEGRLTGIISWGVDCGRKFFPGVYTNVPHFLEWIQAINYSLNYAKFKPMQRYLLSGSSCHKHLVALLVVLALNTF